MIPHRLNMAVLALASLALASCQRSDLLGEELIPDSPDHALALELEGRWAVGSFREDGQELVGAEATYDYAAVDFDYEGGDGGGLEITLASATRQMHLDGLYAADAERGVVSFDGEVAVSYGEGQKATEPMTFELAVDRDGDDVITLSGEVGGGEWIVRATRD